MAKLFHPSNIDYQRWTGHVRKLFDLLADGAVHDRDDIVRHVGTRGFTGRVSDLRREGYIIVCRRANEGGATNYQLTKYVGYDTTGNHKCPTCTCK